MAGNETPVKLDGDFGPNSNERLRKLVLRNGPGAVRNGVLLRTSGGGGFLA